MTTFAVVAVMLAVPLVLRVGSIVLRLAGWFVAVAGMYSIERTGLSYQATVPLVVAILLWFAGQLWFRARHKRWKSRLLRLKIA